MKPYYQDEWTTLYLGDCRGILPVLSVSDLLLTDPPYGIGLDMVLNHGTTDGTIHQVADWNKQSPPKESFDLMYAHSRRQIIWGANYFGAHIRDVGRMVHDKQLQIEGTALRYSEADIASCSFQKRVTMFRYRWNGNVQGDTINWRNTGPDARVHPTQKPLALMKWCIQQAGDVAEVLDPFCGSGTTLRAAKDLGVKSVGIEISEAYCQIAVERLRQAVMAL